MATSSTTNRTPGGFGPPDQPEEQKLRKQRLLDTAAAGLLRWGYRKTILDDVAREAGVGKGALYLYWEEVHTMSAILEGENLTERDAQPAWHGFLTADETFAKAVRREMMMKEAAQHVAR